jgi:hypothetical protein
MLVLSCVVCILITVFITSVMNDVFVERRRTRQDIRAKIGRALESDDHKQIRAAAVQYKPDIEKETFIFMINRADSLEAGAVFAHEDHSKLLAHVFDWKLLSKGRW